MINHLAVIIDGNGRWAVQRGLPRTDGHKEGSRAVLRVIEASKALGVKFLSIYALSTENVKQRDASEVKAISDVIMNTVNREILPMPGINVHVVGGMLRDLSKRGPVDAGLTVTIAVGYGGQKEIEDAVNSIYEKREPNDPTPITFEDIKSAAATRGLPDVDALVRFGGHQRLSNFFPLLTAYTELFFEEKLWPDVTADDIKRIDSAYTKIRRNFGKA